MINARYPADIMKTTAVTCDGTKDKNINNPINGRATADR